MAGHVRLNVSSFMEEKPADAADVLLGVYTFERIHPLERANIAAVRARHLGNAGNVREARNLLGLAEDLMVMDAEEPPPSWAGFLSEPHLMRVLGRSYYSIGDLDTAADRYQRAISGFGPDRARGRAQTMARLGYVYFKQGRIDEAVQQADMAEAALVGVSSARATQNVSDLRRLLAA